MARFESVLDSVGGTPLIRLTRFAEGLRPRIYVKAEWQNPGGGVKDRAALEMLRRAEADGSLAPGGTVVEATSGNTGIGLALVAAHLGYRAVIFTSSLIAREKRAQILAYGAELRLVDAFVPRNHPDSLRSQAQLFVDATPGAWLAGQYDNPANPGAHRATTGPEIWDDTDGSVTHFVATVGTGGTISGTGRYLKDASGGTVRVIGADPLTSTYSGGDGSQKYVEGAGHFVHPLTTVDEWPQALDPDVIDEYVGIEDEAAIDAIRRLARVEGILAGGSSGVALAAALRIAAHLHEDDTVVVLLPDSGRTYLSTYFDDRWLRERGFLGPGTEDEVVGARSSVALFAEVGGSVAEAVKHLEAEGPGENDVVLVRHRRAGSPPHPPHPPHPSDITGWTTLGHLRAAAGGAVVATGRIGARLGAGLALTDPAVTAWEGADDEVALVLSNGRVAGIVTGSALELSEPTEVG